jgi:hypothetical protein
MGISLKNGNSIKKHNTPTEKPIANSDFENVLYKPLSEFSWKDATKSELRKEAISHYSVKFAL